MSIIKFRLLIVFLLFGNYVVNAQKTETNSWYVEGYTEQIAMNYFNRSTLLEPIEGIWQSTDGFKYSIERAVENQRRVSGKYRVIVLESSHDGWKLGQIKGFITSGSVENVYSFKYYTRYYDGTNTRSENLFLKVENPIVISFTKLNGGKVAMYRIYPKIESSGQGENSSGSQWSGSGIAIGDKFIATNYHVVEDANTLVVCGINGDMNTSYKVQIVVTDKKNDLAIVKVIDEKFKGFGTIPYGFCTTTVDVGTEIFVLGYPMTQFLGDEIKVTNGIISAKTGFQGDVSTYQMTAPIQPGNSGGPVFDYKGNLIGLSVSGIKNEVAQNVNYAVKLKYLQNLIESCDEKISLSGKNNIANFTLPDKIKNITPFVLMFKANETMGDKTNNTTPSSKPISQNKQQEAERLKQRSYEKYYNKDYQGAYQDIVESVSLFPTPESHYIRGWLADLVGNNTNYVIESYQYCIEHNYKLEGSFLGLADCFFKQKKYNDAVDMYSKVLMENKKNVHSLYMRALCKSKLGDRHGGILDYMQAIKYEGLVEYDYGTIYNNIAYTYVELENYPMAEKYIKEALKRNHLTGYIWDTDGELAYKKGEYKRCLVSMNNAITIDNKSANSYYYRGLAKIQLGNHSGAYSDYDFLKMLDSLKADTLKEKIDMSKVDFEKLSDGEMVFVYPKTARSSRGLLVRALEITSEYTALHLTFSYYNPEGVYAIDRDAYIVDCRNNKQLLLLKADNCPIIPNRNKIQNGKVDFVLYFPAIEKGCKEIDFYESDENNNNDGLLDNFLIKGIQLKSGEKPKENTMVWQAGKEDTHSRGKEKTKSVFFFRPEYHSGVSISLGIQPWSKRQLYAGAGILQYNTNSYRFLYPAWSIGMRRYWFMDSEFSTWLDNRYSFGFDLETIALNLSFGFSYKNLDFGFGTGCDIYWGLEWHKLLLSIGYNIHFHKHK